MKTNPLNCCKTLFRCFGATLTALALLLAIPRPAAAQVPPPLFTSASTFVATNHILSTTVFHWFPGQVSGPWVPMEGIANWTGTPQFWQGQIKQMMRANVDMLYVHQYADSSNPNLATTNFPASGTDQQLVNFFTAYSQLRAQGYDVPKIAPFLDPQITWYLTSVDLATTPGKDAWANQYIRFYNMYYSVNTDTNADDYLAKQSNKPILDTWATINGVCANASSLTRADVSSRLVAALGTAHPCFTNGFVQVGTAANASVSFVDEKMYQFENNSYHIAATYNGITTMQLKAGYWDQNIRTPGSFLARDGGVNYSNAWTYPDRATVLRANIESWNEYDEGTGIYAGTNAAPYLINGNPNSDTWSTTGDPFEYIKTTARGAAIFCDVPAQSAKILWNNIPATLMPGESRTVTIIVRNAGSDLWTAGTNHKLGQTDASPIVSGGRVLMDDAQDEIPLYGGIFRGRAKAFTFTITAPVTLGTYTNHFQMMQEGVAWFGDTLTNVITVKPKTAASVTLTNLSQMADGHNAKPVSATTTPPGLTVNLTYNGSPYAPTNAGSYTVVGLINDATYFGSVTKTLVISVNGSFEAQTNGTTVSAPPDVVDSATITGWRVFDVNSANVAFSATIISNASAGSHAIRLNVNNIAGGGGYGLDEWDPGMHTPVLYGTNYLITFDAAWIAGATANNLRVAMQEFDNTGTYIGTSVNLGVLSVSATGYTKYYFIWTPQNAGTTEVGFSFAPMEGVAGTTSLSLDNVQISQTALSDYPLDGSFEAHPDGTTAGGSGAFIDEASLMPWRLYNVVPSDCTTFSATIIPNASAGSHAIRLDTVNATGGGGGGYALAPHPGANWPRVNDTVPYYVFSFDAAWVSGDNRLGVILAEFNSAVSFLGQPIYRLPVTNSSYQTFHILYSPVPGAAYLCPQFAPMLDQVGANSLSLDNVKLEIPATLPVNGTFEYSPIGTVSTSGTGGAVDATTFLGWRLFNVGSPAINGFTGTIVDAGSYAGGTPGSHAMRFDVDNTGSPAGNDYALDTEGTRMPVVIGQHYTLSFDLELDGTTGGTLACEATIAEFDAAGAFTGNQTSFTPTLPTDQTFHHYAVDYVPQNANTAKVVISFRPRNPGFVSALVLDNVVFGPYVPVANTVTVYRAAGATTQVKKAKIMSYAALGLTFVSNSAATANGATLTTDADTIYVPASGVDDSFSYTVTDGYGNNGTGTVIVKVGAPTGSPAVSFPNGDFTGNPTSTAIGIGAGGAVDTTTFANWRFYSVGSPAADWFAATIIDASTTDSRIIQGGVPGTPAMRFDLVQTANAGADHGLDRDNARVLVTQGVTYTLSFDAALYGYTGGSLLFQAVLPEFDAGGAFTGTQAIFIPTLDGAFRTYTYSWTPQNSATVEIAGPGFHPWDVGYAVALGLGNVKLHAPVAANLVTNRVSGSPLQVSIADLMAGATDTENHPLTFVGTSATTTNGSALSNDGTYITVPANTVADSFTYKITDGCGATNFATVSVAVTGGMASTPTNIVFSVSGGNTLHLTWPGSHLGWFAQSNSVSLADTNYWFDIIGSDAVTNLNILISPATPNVFYRLRHP